MTLQWEPCEFKVDGLPLRVVRGSKRSADGNHDDMKIEWLTPLGWRPMRFYAVASILDFMMWNEDGLYPPALGYKGGAKLLEYLRHTYRFDVNRAEAGLQAEKGAKHPRLFDEDAA